MDCDGKVNIHLFPARRLKYHIMVKIMIKPFQTDNNLKQVALMKLRIRFCKWRL